MPTPTPKGVTLTSRAGSWPSLLVRPELGSAGWLARHQAWLFFPMLLLEGINLHAAGIRALGRRRGLRVRLAEAALLTVHFGGYLTAVFLVLSPLRALAFIAIQQAVFGIY